MNQKPTKTDATGLPENATLRVNEDPQEAKRRQEQAILWMSLMIGFVVVWLTIWFVNTYKNLTPTGKALVTGGAVTGILCILIAFTQHKRKE